MVQPLGTLKSPPFSLQAAFELLYGLKYGSQALIVLDALSQFEELRYLHKRSLYALPVRLARSLTNRLPGRDPPTLASSLPVRSARQSAPSTKANQKRLPRFRRSPLSLPQIAALPLPACCP